MVSGRSPGAQASSLRLTVNGIKGALLVGRVEVHKLLAHYDGQLDLIVQVHTLGPDAGPLAGLQQGGGRLEEEEGLFWPRAVQLLDMVPRSVHQHQSVSVVQHKLQPGV